MNAHDYAKTHGKRFQDEWLNLLRIPSVSTDPERKVDVQKAAEWVADDMRRIGLENVEIIPTKGHPVVYGEWLGAGADAQTVLVYGHYDVQPAVMEDGWHHDPFDPVERDGKIIARGASDDKGQVMIQLKAVESLLKGNGTAPVNFKFLIEGEEEIGTPNLGQFVVDNLDKLKADICVISDTGIRSQDEPSICYSVRGLLYMELEVFGPEQDLHSGYGGTVYNPAQALAEIISKLHNADGSISVPGFYDTVLALSDDERELLRKSAAGEDHWKKTLRISEFWGEPGYTPEERIGARPTLEINGFAGGWYGKGSKTVLPAKALAKISCRLVANQNPHEIFELIRKYIAQITPSAVRSELRMLDAAFPALIDYRAPAMQAAVTAFAQNWDKPVIFERGGGTLPIVADFQRHLGGLPVILLGFALPDSGAHGPNENFSIDIFHKGIDTTIHFYEEVGKSSS